MRWRRVTGGGTDGLVSVARYKLASMLGVFYLSHDMVGVRLEAQLDIFTSLSRYHQPIHLQNNKTNAAR
jgi:hypothetical protein